MRAWDPNIYLCLGKVEDLMKVLKDSASKYLSINVISTACCGRVPYFRWGQSYKENVLWDYILEFLLGHEI